MWNNEIKLLRLIKNIYRGSYIDRKYITKYRTYRKNFTYIVFAFCIENGKCYLE